jgi:hypothetical protein
MGNLTYRFFGFWVRREACRLASRAMPSDWKDGNFAVHIWSLTVFFEQYMLVGAEGTQSDFGPKGAPVLSLVTADGQTKLDEGA